MCSYTSEQGLASRTAKESDFLQAWKEEQQHMANFQPSVQSDSHRLRRPASLWAWSSKHGLRIAAPVYLLLVSERPATPAVLQRSANPEALGSSRNAWRAGGRTERRRAEGEPARAGRGPDAFRVGSGVHRAPSGTDPALALRRALPAASCSN
ncbi:hypothetical protein AOLI_G00148130 [Acnodon oligacanthus]